MRDYPAAERAEYPMVYEIETPDVATAGLLRSDDLVNADRQFNLRRVWRGVIQEVEHVSD